MFFRWQDFICYGLKWSADRHLSPPPMSEEMATIQFIYNAICMFGPLYDSLLLAPSVTVVTLLLI